MIKELAELTVKKLADYDDEVATALENAGFVVVLRTESITDKNYIIAKNMEQEE